MPEGWPLLMLKTTWLFCMSRQLFSVWRFHAVWEVQNMLFFVWVRKVTSLDAYIFTMSSHKSANLITPKALLFGLFPKKELKVLKCACLWINYEMNQILNHLWLSPFFPLLAQSHQTAHGKIESEALELILNRCVKWLPVSEGWVRMHRSPRKHD